MDNASFSRANEDSLKDFVHILKMKNTDRLCIFTAQGTMYQVKAEKIPKCKIKDKGTLIHNLCKVDKEEILLYIPFEELFESQLMFTTKQGYIKLVSGIEFETNRAVLSTTKLDDGDLLVSILLLTGHMVSSSDSKVILLTNDGLSLGFPLSEVSELKKTSRGVKGIALDSNDFVAFATVVTPDIETFEFNQKQLSAKKVRNRKRGAKGQKATL